MRISNWEISSRNLSDSSSEFKERDHDDRPAPAEPTGAARNGNDWAFRLVALALSYPAYALFAGRVAPSVNAAHALGALLVFGLLLSALIADDALVVLAGSMRMGLWHARLNILLTALIAGAFLLLRHGV